MVRRRGSLTQLGDAVQQAALLMRPARQVRRSAAGAGRERRCYSGGLAEVERRRRSLPSPLARCSGSDRHAGLGVFSMRPV